MPALLSNLVQWSDGIRAGRLAHLLKPHLSGHILDVGCWNGDLARRLSLDMVGIDVVAPPTPAIPVTLFDGRHIPFGHRQFDTALCCFVLHHAEDQDALLAKMKRVSGRIVVVEDDCDGPLKRRSVLLLHGMAAPMIGMPYRSDGFRRSEGWRELFDRHGLRCVSCQRHRGVIPAWPLLRHHLFVLEPK
jgi:ubiquinone/menaquinone biosynthesis C-methylase UbiE